MEHKLITHLHSIFKNMNIIKANEEISETEKKYREVTCKIQNAMRRNMELRIKNNDLL